MEPFRQNMLDHPTDERQRRDLFLLPLLGLVIVVPIAHPLPVVAQDALDLAKEGSQEQRPENVRLGNTEQPLAIYFVVKTVT